MKQENLRGRHNIRTPSPHRWSGSFARTHRQTDIVPAGSVTVRIIGRRVDFTVRINPLMSTPPLQEGLPSGGRRASTNQMRVFLDWLQKCQHATACRILQLTVGRPPKRQAVAYRRLDCRIREAKLRFGLSIGRIFAYIYPDPCSSEQMRVEMLQYLNHVAYLVMGTD